MAEKAKEKAKKRRNLRNVRKAKRRRSRNLAWRKKLKLVLKAARKAFVSRASDAKEKMREAFSIIDKAAEHKIIHANKADRLKSRLSLLYNKTSPVVS